MLGASEAVAHAKRSLRLVDRVVGVLFKIAVFYLGSYAAVAGLHLHTRVTLPTFGLDLTQQLAVWALLALPVYVIAMGAVVVVFVVGLTVMLGLWTLVKHLPQLLGIGIEILRGC